MLLGTTQPHIKYKDNMDKFILIPLVNGKDTDKQVKADKIIELLKTFPQDPKHYYNLEKMPPCKQAIEGNKSMLAVH